MSTKTKSKPQQGDLLAFSTELIPGNVKHFMKDVGASSADLWMVDIDRISVLPDFNVRIRNESFEEGIKDLAQSMVANGFYRHEPLAGFTASENGGLVFYVTDGHRRLEAARLANTMGADIKQLPVVNSAKGTDMEDLTVALVRTSQGVNLTMYEVAIVCKRLARVGWSSQKIGERIGKSSTAVEDMLSLMEAPRELRAMVERESITASTAIDAIKRFGAGALAKLQVALVKAAAAGSAKVKPKHIQPSFRKEVRKAGPKLFLAVRELRTDPGYASINADLREKIEAMLGELDALELAEQHGKSETTQSEGEHSDE